MSLMAVAFLLFGGAAGMLRIGRLPARKYLTYDVFSLGGGGGRRGGGPSLPLAAAAAATGPEAVSTGPGTVSECSARRTQARSSQFSISLSFLSCVLGTFHIRECNSCIFALASMGFSLEPWPVVIMTWASADCR